MSMTQQGPDWWQAVDTLWYPPERHPNYRPPVVSEATQPMNGRATTASATPDQETVVRRLNELIIKAIDEGLGTHQILDLCEARAWVLSPEQSHGPTVQRP
jgi:hypothetical protein